MNVSQLPCWLAADKRLPVMSSARSQLVWTLGNQRLQTEHEADLHEISSS
jgi:hypothetical protein